MKIESVTHNNHKRVFEVVLERRAYEFPYARCDVLPTTSDPIRGISIDPELGNEGFVYVLASGAEGTVLADWVLELNRDPDAIRELILYTLSSKAQAAIEGSGLSKRAVARRLGTSMSQLLRLLDHRNRTKSIWKMIELLWVLGLRVHVDVTERDPVSTSA